MNTNALLALIADLYQQVVTLTTENAELRKVIAESDIPEGAKPAI